MGVGQTVQMGERELIERTETPATVSSIVADLRALGVETGSVLMVHSSMTSLGYVVGGPLAVVTALLDAVGDTGTLVMPTHSSDLTDPAGWSNPPVPESWWPTMHAEMPPYDPHRTPSRMMGAIVETFRTMPGVVRSAHPIVSAAALGPLADEITRGHELDNGLGPRSPQGRVYDLDGNILLLGVDHGNNTSLHVAEFHSAEPGAATETQSSPMLIDGQRRWVDHVSLVTREDDFAELGAAFAETGRERSGPVACATGRLMPSRDLIDFATEWMREHR